MIDPSRSDLVFPSSSRWADFTIYRHGAIADFKLFLDGVEIDYTSNLNIREFFATSIDIVNQPESHYDYWEIQIHKGCEGQQPFSINEATGQSDSDWNERLC